MTVAAAAIGEVDTRDRVIALERDVIHLTAQVEELTKAVRELTELLNQSKGIWKMLVWLMGAAGAVGGVVASAVPWGAFFR